MQFQIILTADFLKRSYARRMFYGGWKLILAALFIVAGIVFDAAYGSFGIVSIVGLSALGLYLLIAALAWLRQSQALQAWLRQQKGEPVTYLFSEEMLESRAQVGSVSLKWEAFRCLRLSEFDTLLEYSSHGALTLPTDRIPPDALAFLKKQFSIRGIRIKDDRKNVTSIAPRDRRSPNQTGA